MKRPSAIVHQKKQNYTQDISALGATLHVQTLMGANVFA